MRGSSTEMRRRLMFIQMPRGGALSYIWEYDKVAPLGQKCGYDWDYEGGTEGMESGVRASHSSCSFYLFVSEHK
ncbi:hypothetical protein E4T56_gene5278 [Termitomyces sp. T112]|nr:hypothetical protein E4T56_gene5278 [Termitomyces sp. T112]